MSLLENIQTLCRERQRTIVDVERGSGLKKSTITKWSTTAPSVYKVAAVADYFGISIDELIGRTPPSVSRSERAALDLLDQLNSGGQDAALAMLQGLVQQPGYIKSDSAEELEG